MNWEFNDVPPGQFWIPVWDLPSALLALDLLIGYIRNYAGSNETPDQDNV